MKSLICHVLFIGLIAAGPAQADPPPIPPPIPGSFITIGDAGVTLMFVPWNSPQLVNLQQSGLTPLQYEQSQQTGILNNAATYSLQGIQYYIGWGVIEPTQGQWDWSQTLLDAQTIKAQGLQFIPYGWVQNQPKWVHWVDPNNPGAFNPSYTRAMNTETGLETDSLSIYAPETKAAYDLFYSNLKTNLGAYIDKLRFACPYDYGEIGYPGGAASDTFPLTNFAPGFYVGEAPARAHFQATMQTKYGSLANLNAAWGTAFTDFGSLPYPTSPNTPATPTQRRYWLDFIGWYQSGLTQKTGELIDIVRGYFPNTLINMNLGWPYEKLNIGQDISGLLKMSAQRGMSVCSGTGSAVPFLNTKRAATASRFYGGQWLANETGGSTEPLSSMAMSFFKDLSDGVNWPFSYGANLSTGVVPLGQFRQIGPTVSNHRARTDMAMFFPTTAHRLDDWDSWRQSGTSGGYPGNLQSFCESIRDVCDYGVIDEQMIGDGALNQYKILVWEVGTTAEAQTMSAIAAWVQNGGVLLAIDFTSIRDVEGDSGAFAALSALPKVGDMRVAGQGFIFDGAGSQQRLTQWIVQRGNMTPLNASYPAKITTLPVIDNASNGILTTEFTNGVLLFNTTTTQKTVTLPPLDGQGSAQQVTVPPYTDGTTAGLVWVARVTQLPTITMFTPASAPVGATVTITGTNLTGATSVKFNGVTATIISNSDTQIVVIVPAGATSGTLSVSIAGGTANSTTTCTILPTPTITSSSPLAHGTVGTSYSLTLTASGGTPGYAWAVSNGALPAGLLLSASGALNGTPTAAGTFNFAAQVTDSASVAVTKGFTVAVFPQFIPLTPTPLPGGNVQVTWPSILGLHYQMEYSPDLGQWFSIGVPAPGTGATMPWTDDGSQTGSPPSAATKRFYRLRISE
jgi:hypothetical protein